MYYIVYALALTAGLFFPGYIVSESIGVSIAMYGDAISLIVTVGASYLFVAAGTSNFNFFKNDEHMALWGDMCLRMGFIGFLLGVIGILQGMTSTVYDVGPACAVAILTIFYGAVFKYLIIVPWLTCKKNCKINDNSE